MFDIWRLLFLVRERDLARAAVKASSWNGFGCARYFVRPLQVLVRVWNTCAVAWPGVRWHVKLRQEGPYPLDLAQLHTMSRYTQLIRFNRLNNFPVDYLHVFYPEVSMIVYYLHCGETMIPAIDRHILRV